MQPDINIGDTINYKFYSVRTGAAGMTVSAEVFDIIFDVETGKHLYKNIGGFWISEDQLIKTSDA